MTSTFRNISSYASTHALFWTLTVLIMLEDDVAMLAFMFC